METLYKSITALVFVAWLFGTVYLETGGAIHIFLGIGIFALANGYLTSQARKRRMKSQKPLQLGATNCQSVRAFGLGTKTEIQPSGTRYLEGELSTNITLAASSAEDARCEILQNVAGKLFKTREFRKAYNNTVSANLNHSANSSLKTENTAMEVNPPAQAIAAQDSPQEIHLATPHPRRINFYRNHHFLRTLMRNSGSGKVPKASQSSHKYPRSLNQTVLLLKGWSLAKCCLNHPTSLDPIYPSLGALPSA